MSDPIIQINQLNKQYKNSSVLANDNISVSINEGEVFGLLGPNGAGKSTLVRQIAGLVKPTSGVINVFGYNFINEPNMANELVALQPQNIWLPAQTKPQEILEYTGRLRGMPIAEVKKEAEEYIHEFGLEEHLNKKMQILSGGLKRLVAIAVTLIGNRPIVVLDEPTNDLDPKIRRIVWKKIKETTDKGRTVILVTHNVLEAEQTLDRVSFISEGRILATGTPSELKAQLEQRLRLEITTRPTAEEDIAFIVSKWPETQRIGENKFIITVPQEEAEDTFTHLLPHLQEFQDFRIITTNLEDIYFELSGGNRIES